MFIIYLQQFGFSVNVYTHMCKSKQSRIVWKKKDCSKTKDVHLNLAYLFIKQAAAWNSGFQRK